MEPQQIPTPTATDLVYYEKWWSKLSSDWKKAFNEVMLRQSDTSDMPIDVIHSLHHSPALRFVGPTGPYPNMSFELSNLTGLIGLKKVEILVVNFHQVADLRMLAELPQIKSLFVNNNRIQSLDGLEHLSNLQELYCQMNHITALKPLEKLTHLHTLYCNHNSIASLEGITEAHAAQLNNFYCQPNEGLMDNACLKFEQTVGIRCRKA